jgi:hypothetical protein
MVWRGPGQVSGSLTRPDLSCGATFLPEDPTLAPLVLSSLRGTEGSNPSPSSGESETNRFLGELEHSAADRRLVAAKCR